MVKRHMQTTCTRSVWPGIFSKIYCYANFFCYANFSIVFGPNFRGAKVSGGGANCLRGAPAFSDTFLDTIRQYLTFVGFEENFSDSAFQSFLKREK